MTGGGCWRRGLGALALLWAGAVAAAEVLIGSPPVARHAPDLAVFPQNFAIAQDSRGVVYLGNTDGVLEFDGATWQLWPLANREIVRSLAVGPDDRVYVGGYNAFGYLERDATGAARMVDLAPRFRAALDGREFADIWDTVVAPEGVYFRALFDVFFWDPARDTVAHWHHSGRFGAIAHDAGRTLLQFRGEGFRVREGDGWVPLPGTAALVELVYELVPLPDGGLLAFGADGHWRRLQDGVVSPLPMPTALPDATHFENALLLSNGSLAFASLDGMLYLVDARRQRLRHVRLDPGFLSGLWPARDGGFLVVGDEAFYRVAWPAPWTVLSGDHGAEGSFNRLVRTSDGHWLLTSAGAYRVDPTAHGPPTFTAPRWSVGASYDYLALGDGRSLLAGGHRLFVIADDRAREVTPELVYPRRFWPARHRPGRIHVGTEAGLRLLDVVPSGFALSARGDGPDRLVTTLVESGPDELWYGTLRHGLWRVRLAADGTIAEERRVGEEAGLALGVVPRADVTALPDGTLLVSTAQGIFRRVAERFVPEPLHGLAARRGPEEVLRVVADDDGTLWAYGSTRLFRRAAGADWQEQPVRALRRGALIDHAVDGDGHAVFVASQALLLFDPTARVTDARPPQALLRAVTLVHPDGRREPLPLAPSATPVLARGDWGINFQFALPELAQPEAVRFRGRLFGSEPELSPWSDSRSYTYSRMRAGTYRLDVEALDPEGRVSAIPSYAVRILPPWYARWWAWLIWGALAALLAARLTQAAIRQRVARLAADKQRLEGLVAERTGALEAANERLREAATLDGLTGIANRRRLDEYLAQVWAQARERQRPVAVLAIDVDHFKRFNDSHGHLAGDQLLRDLAQRLGHGLRRSEDLLARYGGEEFLVVMPGAELPTAIAVAEQLRRDVEAAALGATISIGVASGAPDGPDWAELVQAADEALYAAKRAGRNRVVPSS